MDAILHPYLKELTDYASIVRVPGLDISSEPMRLEDIFIEPQVKLEAKGASFRTRRGLLRGLFSVGKEEGVQEPQRAESEPANALPPEAASDALTRESRLVIVGEPGQGKSTLMRQYAARLAATQNGTLPLLVELGQKRAWTGNESDAFEWLRQRMPESLKRRLQQESWQACCVVIQSGKATVLLDGFDELSEDARVHVVELLAGLKGNRLVLSSRPDAYRRIPLPDCKVYALRELRPDQVEKLALKLCNAIGAQFGVDGEAACSKVLGVARSQVGLMARNPLLLSFMCLTAVSWEEEGRIQEFPSLPGEVLAECVEALVEWHRNRTYKPGSDWPRELTSNSVVRILGKLALRSFDDESGLIHPEALQELSDAEEAHFRDHLVQTRFVVQQHWDFAFPIETFREYFAARALASSPDPFTIVKPQLHKPEWQRVIVYCAGNLKREKASIFTIWFPSLTWLFMKALGPLLRVLARFIPLFSEEVKEVGSGMREHLSEGQTRSRQTAEFFITAIWTQHCRWGRRVYESILHRDLNLAALCVGAAPARCPNRLAIRIAGPLASNAQENALAEAGRHPEIRRRWMELSRSPLWILLLQRILLGSSSDVPSNAMHALKTVTAETDVRSWLIEESLSKYRRQRSEAASAMSTATFDPNVRERLLAMARDSREHWVTRSIAMESLKAAKVDYDVMRALLELTRDQDPKVRKAATRTLATPLDKPERDTQTEPAGAAAAAAHGTSSSSSADELQVQNWLLTLSQDEESSVREAAVEGLQRFAHRAEVLQRLLLLIRDDDFTVWHAAAGALSGVANDERVQESIFVLTRDPDCAVRARAASVFKTAAFQPAVQDRLLELTRDDNCDVRRTAIDQLAGSAGERRVRERLLELTYDEDSVVRATAAEACKSVAAEAKVRERLLELTKDDDFCVRSKALAALARVANDPQVRERLLELSRSKPLNRRETARAANDSSVQEAAVEALEGALGHPSVQSRLCVLTWPLLWEWGFLMQVLFLAAVIGWGLQSLPHVLNWLPPHLHAQLVNLTYRGIATLGEHEPKFTKAAVWIFPWAIYLGHWAMRCVYVAMGVVFVIIIAEPILRILGIRYPHRENLAQAALKALRSWRGPVPRTVLWRTAYLAVVHPTSDRVQTLQALLQARETSLQSRVY